MTIELLTQQEYDTLLRIQKEHPKLTFQNVGYQYIDRSKLSEDDKKADEEVKAILSKHIKNFREFNNFKLRENGEIVVRFQYVWDPEATHFTGAGYITLRELFKGFDNPDEVKAPKNETINPNLNRDSERVLS